MECQTAVVQTIVENDCNCQDSNAGGGLGCIRAECATVKPPGYTGKSGDPENIEAQAARHYWPLLMGSDFRRDRQAPGVNGLLNYGYTVLRASVARAIVASGLHPSIGLHHRNKLNAFALADDLMEPFRPLVDCTVLALNKRGIEEVGPDAKSVLAGLIALDLDLGDTRSPLTTALNGLCYSLAQSFESGKPCLILPKPPSPLELIALGGADGPT